MLNPCVKCVAAAIQHDHMLRVVCSGCRQSTPNMQGTLGEFQAEHAHASYIWNRDNPARPTSPERSE